MTPGIRRAAVPSGDQMEPIVSWRALNYMSTIVLRQEERLTLDQEVAGSSPAGPVPQVLTASNLQHSLESLTRHSAISAILMFTHLRAAVSLRASHCVQIMIDSAAPHVSDIGASFSFSTSTKGPGGMRWSTCCSAPCWRPHCVFERWSAHRHQETRSPGDHPVWEMDVSNQESAFIIWNSSLRRHRVRNSWFRRKDWHR